MGESNLDLIGEIIVILSVGCLIASVLLGAVAAAWAGWNAIQDGVTPGEIGNAAVIFGIFGMIGMMLAIAGDFE